MGDERFRALATDPRYRLPSRKQAQTAVDSRFGRLFTDDAFQRKATVDRYGRKIKQDTAKKDLRRRFRLDDEEQAQNARLASSEEEGSSESEEESLEDGIERDLAREGFSGSSSEEESTSEEEDSEDEVELAEETAGAEQVEDVPTGDVTKRIAVVNLDWDHIRAADIMAVAQSFAPTGGRIVNTTVYPSEFGLERMQKEELEGPPRDIFASSQKKSRNSLRPALQSDDDDEDAHEDDSDDSDDRIRKSLLDAQAKDGAEFDTAKLRQYQLERLRYYYAVITCDDETTAKELYDSMDGREYLTTANFFDLRFIPVDTTFDSEPREECNRIPDGYKPNDFRTEALTHSKVRLTWDDDDTTRKEVQKRAFSRAELDENDLRAYIGSDSSDADSVTSRKSAAADRKIKKKETARTHMRALLGLPDTAAKRNKSKDDEPVGDMQITFSAGLSAKQEGKGVFENEPQDEASTRERYIRKERERKQKRKEKMKAGKGTGLQDDTAEVPAKDSATIQASGDDAIDPFDDPFFNDPKAAAKAEANAKKAERQKKHEAKVAADEAAAARRAELELLMVGDEHDAVRHFDMKDIERAEKLARKKGKKQKHQKATSADNATTDDFKIEAADPRFKQLFESHEYAIDPTNPRYKGTQAMKDLLEVGRKKRKARDDGDGEIPSVRKKNKDEHNNKAGSEDLSGLVARLKKQKPK